MASGEAGLSFSPKWIQMGCENTSGLNLETTYVSSEPPFWDNPVPTTNTPILINLIKGITINNWLVNYIIQNLEGFAKWNFEDSEGRDLCCITSVPNRFLITPHNNCSIPPS